MVRAAMAEPCWDDGIEVLSGTPAWFSLTARCDLATANRLVQFLHGVRDPSIPEAEKDQVISAFREILINAMEHGAHFDPSQHVEISFIRGLRANRLPRQGSWQRVSPSKNFVTQRSAARQRISSATRGFAMNRACGQAASAFCWQKKLVDELIYNEKGNEVVLIKYLDSP